MDGEEEKEKVLLLFGFHLRTVVPLRRHMALHYFCRSRSVLTQILRPHESKSCLFFVFCCKSLLIHIQEEKNSENPQLIESEELEENTS